MMVADVRRHGYAAIRLARLVDPTGKVYANDLQPPDHSSKAREQLLSNVEIVPGTESGAPAGERH